MEHHRRPGTSPQDPSRRLPDPLHPTLVSLHLETDAKGPGACVGDRRAPRAPIYAFLAPVCSSGSGWEGTCLRETTAAPRLRPPRPPGRASPSPARPPGGGSRSRFASRAGTGRARTSTESRAELRTRDSGDVKRARPGPRFSGGAPRWGRGRGRAPELLGRPLQHRVPDPRHLTGTTVAAEAANAAPASGRRALRPPPVLGRSLSG